MVVAGGLHRAADDRPQQGPGVHGDAVPVVAVVPHRAVGVVHVLHHLAPARGVDHLQAPADRQQRDAAVEADPGHGEVEGVLLRVDVVERRVLGLARPAAREVPTTGQQDTVGDLEAYGDLRVVGHALRGVGVDDERLTAGGPDRLDEVARG